MFKLKMLGHSVVVLVLGVLAYAVSGHIPALNGYMQMTVQDILTVGLTWAYAHFGIVPTVIKGIRAGQVS